MTTTKRRKKYGPALWKSLPNVVNRKTRAQMRRSEIAQYTREAREFINNLLSSGSLKVYCPVAACVFLELIQVSEVHHKFGRRGKLLLWKPGWIAISQRAHEWVHKNPEDARILKAYAPVGFWNNPKAITQFPDGIIR